MAEQLCLDMDNPRDAYSREARVRAINGKELPDWQHGPRFSDYHRMLVTNGWSLTTLVDRKTLIYERPEPAPNVKGRLPASLEREFPFSFQLLSPFLA